MLLWVCGQSGCGKTTAGEGLRTSRGFAHFDGDVWASGGDPLLQTGIPDAAMMANASADAVERRALFAELGATFGDMFEGKSVELERWLPFHRAICQAVRAAWLASDKSMVVSFSVYRRDVRDFIRAQLPEVRFVVLDDVAGGAARRKLRQVLAAAEAANQTLAEFLSKFPGWEDGVTEEALLERLQKIQRGFEPADESKGEIRIDVLEGMTSEEVLEKIPFGK